MSKNLEEAKLEDEMNNGDGVTEDGVNNGDGSTDDGMNNGDGITDDGVNNGDGITDDGVNNLELEEFEAADIDASESLSSEAIVSIVESLLFSTDKPLTVAAFKQAFKGTQVLVKDVRRALEILKVDYEDDIRGVRLEEVAGGYQLRTKKENMIYVQQMVKARSFRLSGPALEVLSIVAYKQPCVKSQVDDVRGVESGHLLRALMNRGLVAFDGKSDAPGKPMRYKTTRKFLEVFSLKNISDLPSLKEIDQLIPEGISEEEEKEGLGEMAESLVEKVEGSYSRGEEELASITDQLSQISTTSEFFEQEKQRMRAQRDLVRAKDIREAALLEEEVSANDRRWLERYDLRTADAAGDDVAASDETVSANDVAAGDETVSANDVAASDETVSANDVTADDDVAAGDDVAASDDVTADDDVAAGDDVAADDDAQESIETDGSD